MFSIIVAFVFTGIAVLNILLICGLPLGELTMGGQYKVLPKKMKPFAILSLLFQVFAIMIVLQSGGHMGLWFSQNVTRIICYIFGFYFVLNAFMCLFSKSKKEKYIMTPLATLAAVYFLMIAWQMK